MSERWHKWILKNASQLFIGRHFWLDEDNQFCSCPTFNDGNPDLDHVDYVSDWTELDDVNLDQLFFIHAHLVKENVTV